jgi:hypothetical protein
LAGVKLWLAEAVRNDRLLLAYGLTDKAAVFISGSVLSKRWRALISQSLLPTDGEFCRAFNRQIRFLWIITSMKEAVAWGFIGFIRWNFNAYLKK